MIQRNDEFQPAGESSACPLCGYRMEGYQCKLVCPNCGYREDCSDLFQAGPMEPPAEQREQPAPTRPEADE